MSRPGRASFLVLLALIVPLAHPSGQTDVSGLANSGAIHLGDDPLYHDSVGMNLETFVPAAASSMVSELAGGLNSGLLSHRGLPELAELLNGDKGSVHAASGELRYPIHLYRLPGPITDQATDLSLTYRSFGTDNWTGPAFTSAVSLDDPFGPGWHPSWLELLELTPQPVPLASRAITFPTIVSGAGTACKFVEVKTVDASLLSRNAARLARTDVFTGPKGVRILCEIREERKQGLETTWLETWCKEYSDGTRIEYEQTPHKGILRPVRVFKGDIEDPQWSFTYRYGEVGTRPRSRATAGPGLIAPTLALQELIDHRGLRFRFHWNRVGGVQRVTKITLDHKTWGYAWDKLTTSFQYETTAPYRLSKIVGARRDFVADLDRSGAYEASEFLVNKSPTMKFTYRQGNLLHKVIDESGGAARQWQQFTWDSALNWRVASQVTGDPALPNPPAGQEARTHLFSYPNATDLQWVDPRGVVRTYTRDDFGQSDPGMWQVVTIRRALGPTDPRPPGTNYPALTWQLAWDFNLSGLLQSATLPSGRTFEFQWAFGLRLPVSMSVYPNSSDPVLTRTWSWTSWNDPDVRLRNRLATFVDRLGQPGQVDYYPDANGVTSEIKKNGVVLFRVREDNQGRALWQDELAFAVDGGGSAGARIDWQFGANPALPDYKLINQRSRGGPLGPRDTFTFEGPGFHVATTDAMGGTTVYGRNVADRVTQLTPPLTASGPFGQYAPTVTVQHDLRGDQAIVSVPAYGHAGTNSLLPHGVIERRKVYDVFGRIWKVYQDVTPLDDAGPTIWEVRTFTFDKTDRLVSVAIDDGQELQYVLDDHDRLYQRKRRLDAARVACETFDYDTDGAIERYDDGAGFVVNWGYDPYGRYVQRDDSGGIEVLYGYDAENRSLNEEIRGNGSSVRTHHFDRDAFGRVWNERITSPSAGVEQSTVFQFTGLDRVAREIHEDGRSTSYFYDALGRLGRVTDDTDGPGTGNEDISLYDDLDREIERRLIVRIEDGTGVRTQVDRRVFTPDAWGRTIRVDRYGDQATILASEHFGYATTGDLVLHLDALGQATTAKIDALGRTREVMVDPVGGAPMARMYADFIDDPSDPDLGLVVVNTDAEGMVSEAHFDLGGRLVEERHPGYSPAPRSMVWDYSYDDADRLTGWIDGNGTDVRIDLDAARRPRRMWVANPWVGLSDLATEIDYQYDELGRESLARVWYGQFGNAAGPHPAAQLLVSVARAFDGLERPLSESFGFLDDGSHQALATKTVTSGWALPGGGEDIEFRRSLTLPSGARLDYSPDGAGRVAGIGLDSPGHMLPDFAQLSYAGAQLAEISTRTSAAPSRLYTRLAYDSMGMLAGVVARFGTGVGGDPERYGLSVRRNLEGDVEQLAYDKADGSGGDWILLDGFGRQREFKLGVPKAQLGGTYAAASAARTIGFGYDRNHNREWISIQSGGGLALLESYSLKPGSNQYEKAEGSTVACDGNGNIVEDDKYRYRYDFLDRLSQVDEVDQTGTITVGLYGHDADHRRVVRFANGVVTFSAWDREDIVEEYDAAFAPTTSFIDATDSAPDLHLAFLVHSGPMAGIHGYIQDHQGSVVRIVDASGNTIERYEYDPYGQRSVFDAAGVARSASLFGNDYGFTGRAHDDESGLVYYRKRYYSPRLGRFLSSDRLGVWADGLNVGNEFAYVGSRPQTLIDPSGDIGLLCKLIPGGKGKKPGKGGKGGKGGKDGPDGGGQGGNPRSGGGCRGGTAGGTDGGTKGGTKGSGTDGGTKGGDGKGGDGKGGSGGGAAGGGAAGGGAGSGAGGGAGAGGGSGGVVKEITVDADKYPESAKHLEDAGAVGKPLTVDRGGAAKRRREALKGVEPVPGFDRDECPPAVFEEGGAGSSVRPVPPGDNRGAGASIGNQLKGVKDGEKVVIKIVRGGK